jgi:MtN3 and saliva related transmembrane protein
MFTVGILLWLLYGIVLWSWPIMIANALTFALALTILTLKLRYG